VTNENVLYYGDNLDILRRYVKDEAVDLIYLDPPFKSDQNYNVLFKERDGTRAASQIQAFKDTWTWNQARPANPKQPRVLTCPGRAPSTIHSV
jgi:site-specific DNA-methyltransferase (adenine-specific)